MDKSRLEAFTDGVVAIIITIMVLELKVPHGSDWGALGETVPIFLAYVLSFVNVGIFWNNHHHMLHATGKIDGRVLWSNLALLFWLSLVPFAIRWIGEAGVTPLPTASYGLMLTGAAISYGLLERAIIAANGPDSLLAKAITSRWKEKLSIVLYAASLPLAFISPYLSIALYVVNALIWLVPDRRIENHPDVGL